MISFDINRFEIEIKRHAFIRAVQRRISPEMIEACIRSGKLKRFGKNNVRLIKQYKNFSVICVGEICADKIKIMTITVK